MNTNEAVEKLIAASKKLLREDLHPISVLREFKFRCEIFSTIDT